MAIRLDQHGSEKFRKLFEENTAEPGSLGEIVDKHSGDSIFLTDEDDGSVNGIDGGEADFISEMGANDPGDIAFPGEPNEEGDDDILSDESLGVNMTGTVKGIAPGFGSHVPLDFGKDGFQIEELPDDLVNAPPRKLRDGEELDDYDDDKSND